MFEPKSTSWQINEDEFPNESELAERLKFLLRYAVIAPSSHNTQPWKFSIFRDSINVLIDQARWLRVADADKRELHISVGCALENILIASAHFGNEFQVSYFPEPANDELAAKISVISRGGAAGYKYAGLFPYLTARHTNHRVYDYRPIAESDQQKFHDCCIEEGIKLYLTDDVEIKRQVDGLIAHSDAIEFANPDFREELGFWIGQGVFGTPWLISKLGQLATTYLDMGGSTAKKDSELLMSAPLLGLICSKDNRRETQVKVGQIFERIYLTASMLGISLQPMSQIVQVPETKTALQKLIPEADLYPQQPFRLGYAEQERGHTPRRPLEEVLV